MKKHLKWVAVALLALPLNPIVAFGVGRLTATNPSCAQEDEYRRVDGACIHIDELQGENRR